VGDDIAKSTSDWKGLKITVQLTIQNRQAKISVVPSAASLIIKALKEPPRDRKKVKHVKHDGNITIDNIYDIAREMRSRSIARTFAGTVKEMLGTAQSVGCTIDGDDPHSVIEKIDAGEIECPVSSRKYFIRSSAKSNPTSSACRGVNVDGIIPPREQLTLSIIEKGLYIYLKQIYKSRCLLLLNGTGGWSFPPADRALVNFFKLSNLHLSVSACFDFLIFIFVFVSGGLILNHVKEKIYFGDRDKTVIIFFPNFVS